MVSAGQLFNAIGKKAARHRRAYTNGSSLSRMSGRYSETVG
jgi:hypothetical protein